MNYWGSHAIDFENYNFEDLKYFTIYELRKIDIPEDILLMEYDSMKKQFSGYDTTRLTEIVEWSPVSFPGFTDDKKYKISNILSIGPMGMSIIFTPEYIILPSTIYVREDWYSPNNKDKVQAWRSYYFEIITHFGGDHALYADQRVVNRHYVSLHKSEITAFAAFEQTLIEHYGVAKKTLFDYPHGKYPKYYIDHFTDITKAAVPSL